MTREEFVDEAITLNNIQRDVSYANVYLKFNLDKSGRIRTLIEQNGRLILKAASIPFEFYEEFWNLITSKETDSTTFKEFYDKSRKEKE